MKMRLLYNNDFGTATALNCHRYDTRLFRQPFSVILHHLNTGIHAHGTQQNDSPGTLLMIHHKKNGNRILIHAYCQATASANASFNVLTTWQNIMQWPKHVTWSCCSELYCETWFWYRHIDITYYIKETYVADCLHVTQRTFLDEALVSAPIAEWLNT